MNRRHFLKYALFGGAAALAASYTVFVERNIVQVNRYKIPIADLRPSFHGFTLAHLTDLHFGFLVSESFIDNIIRGLITTPKAPLFISRGVGWAIYPVRFNCFPEIAVLELVNPKLVV